MTRPEWARATIPVWIQIAEPVARSISHAAERLLTEQMPEDAEEDRPQAFEALGRLGGTLFSLQLGQIVGQLSEEVNSGGDLGIPLLDGGLEHLAGRKDPFDQSERLRFLGVHGAWHTRVLDLPRDGTLGALRHVW